MPPPRTCNCGKASCFTCHRRIVNERYRAAHPIDDPQPRHANRKADGTFAPEPRRAMCKAGLHPMHEGNGNRNAAPRPAGPTKQPRKYQTRSWTAAPW
jgi:hypothetical protein